MAFVPDALELPANERDSFLDASCVDSEGNLDISLRSEAARMVAASVLADESEALASPFQGLAVDAASETTDDSAEIPAAIGPWIPSRQIGRGGMGVVYLARRADGSQQRDVAIKVLQTSPYLQDQSKRFGAEQRILSRLEHPNIARLYDGGLTDDGAPYLVMEYIDGMPITKFCAAEGLNVQQRVALFQSVCKAVAYAHQNLVVHRDIKPSNIFVAQDGSVKLLDFGIAKLLDEDPEDEVPLTRTGQTLMTPEYAAPEQVRGEAVTTATDVYSLGIVLYEILVGERPYTFDSRTPSAIERVICESTPTRPSTAARRRIVTSSGKDNQGARIKIVEANARDSESKVFITESSNTTAHRGLTNASKFLRGDLDTIILKALSKNPARRYSSAAQLADDLRNYADGLPVSARPDTPGYRIKKFVTRHKLGVASATAVLIALVAGLVGTIWQANVARAEARKADATKNFIQEMLSSADPYEGDNATEVTVVQILDSAAVRIGRDLAETPDVEAEVRQTIGTAYRGLGKYPQADSQLTLAIHQLESVYGRGAPETATALRTLADLYIELSRYDEADSLFRSALSIHKKYPGPGNRDLAQSLGSFGAMALQRGEYEVADEHLLKALGIMDNLPLPLSRSEAGSQNSYRYFFGVLKYDLGEYDASDSLLSLAISDAKRQPKPWAAFVGGAMNIHAWVNDYLGNLDEVEPLLLQALAFRQDRFGPNHVEVGYTINDLAYYYQVAGDIDRADSMYVEAISIFEKAVGGDSRTLGTLYNNRAALFRASGRAKEAIPLLERAVEIQTDLLGPEHMEVTYAINGLGHVYVILGDYKLAEEYYRKTLEIRKKVLPAGHTDIAGVMTALARCLVHQERADEAETIAAEAVQLQAAALGPEHRDTAEAELELGRALVSLNEKERAREILLRIRPIIINAYGEDAELSKVLSDLLEKTVV